MSLSYKGWSCGDIAVRKNRLCRIINIHFETSPPSVTVKMMDNDVEANTEFNRLSIPSNEDMLKMPLKCSSNSKNKNKSEKEEKPNKANSKKRSRKTFDDEKSIECIPKKKIRLQNYNSSNPKIISNGWKCNACTVDNQDMNENQCFLCSTPRDFTEQLIYPSICAETEHELNENANQLKNESNTNNNNIHPLPNEQKNNSSTKIIARKADEISFLTWNVWFNEDLRVVERIQAIGKEIERQSIDVICFQEVTPFILDIIRNGAWFKNGKYTCEPDTYNIQQKSYFNIIITRLEFDGNVQYMPFKCSSMERYLTLVPIKVSDYQSVLFATTHLESPVGGNDKYREKRWEQLKISLNILDRMSEVKEWSVVFGGDFNWLDPTKNKENDGLLEDFLHKYRNININNGNSSLNEQSLKLKNNWIDCWSELRPNEDGYTYDLKVNEMMYGWYRNRLDRILFKSVSLNGKQRNFKLKSIQMVGDQPIGNLTHEKVIKRKNGGEIKILKILPSDHFGLLAKFEIK